MARRVPAIQQKRTVAFLNQFVVHTVQFLNRFSRACEEKLSSLSLRMQQIETTLNILEAKLSSIPGLEDVQLDVSDSKQNNIANGPVSTPANSRQPDIVSPQAEQNLTADTAARKTETPSESVVTVGKDPHYARYLKMVLVGVPLMAIRNKMISEGLDPDLLQTPDAPLPNGGTHVEAEESSNSESSFSD
uniref:WASH complex subunit 3 n=1 Tax=Geotrypetes seraphini TaxID=260995 RepID=A0A6P8RSR5_GEOSA|nr:WASH complex subunit 3 isoform X2 [Geotrypetes seraphini]